MDCPVCEKEYKNERGVKQHCSIVHTDKQNPYKSKIVCKNCDDGFWILDSYIDMGKGKFCSKDCEDSFGRVEKICKNCGDNFTLHKNEDERRESNGTFCSMECKSDYKSVDRNCNICGEKIHVKRALVESDRGKYCSKECYYRSETKDTADIRNTSAYKEWKKSVKERDSCCVDCGSSENLHAHHIVPVSENEDLATDVDNGKLLCEECHAKRHPEIAHLITESFNTNTPE